MTEIVDLPRGGAASTDLPPVPVAAPVHLGRFSDEELVFLDAEHPLVHLPHHDRLDEAGRAAHLRAAERALRTRGHERTADGSAIELPQHVCDLLQVREGAPHVVVAQVMFEDDDGARWMHEHYAYLQDGLLVLEDVDADGLHDFWAADEHELSSLLQDRMPPVGATCTSAPGTPAVGGGEPFEVDLAATAAGVDDRSIRRLGRVVGYVDAVSHRRGTAEPPLVSAVLGELGCAVGAAPSGSQECVRLTPVAPGELGAALVGFLTAAQ